MRIRFGNGMVLWLGGALLAHAALLALPGATPEGRSTSRSGHGLHVRIGSAVDPAPRPTLSHAVEKSQLAVPEAVTKSTAEASVTEPKAPPQLQQHIEITQQRSGPTDPSAVQLIEPPEPILVGLKSDPQESSKTPQIAERDSARKPDGLTSLSSKPSAQLPSLVPKQAPSQVHASSSAPETVERSQNLEAAQVSTQLVMASEPPHLGPKSDLQEANEAELVGRASARQSPSGGQAVVHTGPDVDAHARLLALTNRLHRAIEREKRYPLSARRLGREGTASVAFRLRPDGAIDGLQVASSSGEPSLDRAALRAVSGIIPFGEARHYLDETAPFRVDIAFRLR